MSKCNLYEKVKIWYKVYQRIRFFKKMYPLKSIIKDMFLLPLDYAVNHRDIKTVRNVTLSITHNCNIRCEMCYFKKELGNKHILPLSLFKRIINSVKNGQPSIILSGGEPFTHPNLIDMVIFAKKKRLPVQIFTNGILAKPEIVKKLVEFGLDYIDFSLLGNEKSHSLVARSPNAYNDFIKNLEYISNNRGNTLIILNYTITPRSLIDIYHAVELVKKFKLNGLRIQHFNFLLPGEFQAQSDLISKLFDTESSTHEIEGFGDLPSMAKQIIDFIKCLPGELPGVPVQWAPSLRVTEIENWYSRGRFSTQRKCLFPWRGILVDASGKIFPCSKIYLELGDANSQEVFYAWNSDKMEKFRRNLKKGLFPACSRCCKL